MPTAHGSSPTHAFATDSLEEGYPPLHNSRGTGEALSRLASNMPFMDPLKQVTDSLRKPLALFIRQLHFPILKPFEGLDFVTNHMFSGLAPGFADQAYNLIHKVIPTGLISKLTNKIGGGGGVAKLLIAGLGKVGINTADDNIKAVINELVKGLGDIYDPKFLKQFGNFFTDALQNGNVAYLKLTDALIQRASANLRDTVAQTLSQGMSAIGNRTAQAAGTGAITETTQETATKANAAQKAINAPQQTLDKAKPITSQAVQSITPQTQKPTGKKVQSPDNKSQLGFLPNLLTSGNNILKSITGIFSPKPAPAAA
jgi:hypothetical protein